MKTFSFVILPLLAMTLWLSADDAPKTPVEAGTVTWLHDYDTAIAQSGKTGKPIFLLFQEIPGCAGCKQFGKEVMSDPQLVEAVETEFVPLLIPNNQPGKAAEILKKFKEPAWNYQVVRFLDAKGNDLIPRKDRVWTTPHVAARMADALEKANRPVPNYLKALGAAGDSADVKTAAFSMFCFWTGEAKLGTIPGVISTEAGFYDGHEVTLLKYRSDEISLPQLAQKAVEFECANAIYLSDKEQLDALKKSDTRLKTGELNLASYRKAPKSDQKKQISGTSLVGLPMSETQSMHINSTIRSDSKKALAWLSPRQRSLLQ